MTSQMGVEEALTENGVDLDLTHSLNLKKTQAEIEIARKRHKSAGDSVHKQGENHVPPQSTENENCNKATLPDSSDVDSLSVNVPLDESNGNVHVTVSEDSEVKHRPVW